MAAILLGKTSRTPYSVAFSPRPWFSRLLAALHLFLLDHAFCTQFVVVRDFADTLLDVADRFVRQTFALSDVLLMVFLLEQSRVLVIT